jgi:alpha-tubulin suppressor-like RCC1 family protein
VKRLGVAVSVALVAVVGCRGGAASRPASMVDVAQVAPAPVQQVAGSSGISEPREPPIQLVATLARLCMRADGHLYCASMSELDQPLVRPANEVAGIEDATSFAMGRGDGCAVTRRGTVLCFGDNTFGQLGAKLGAERSESAVEVAGVARARHVFAGPLHACASLEGGTLRCWGNNANGQTGSDTIYLPEARELAGSAEVPGVKSESVACTYGATCAVTASQEVSCWGRQEGLMNSPSNQRPTLVPGLSGIDEVAAGDSAFCGLRRGEVVCWGEGRRMVAGADERSAVSVVPGIRGAKHLSIVDDHGCALLGDGRVACFGFPYSHALGRAADDSATEPVPGEVIDGLPRATAVTTSLGISCALTTESELFCWGRWYSQQGEHDEPKPFRLRLR